MGWGQDLLVLQHWKRDGAKIMLHWKQHEAKVLYTKYWKQVDTKILWY